MAHFVFQTHWELQMPTPRAALHSSGSCSILKQRLPCWKDTKKSSEDRVVYFGNFFPIWCCGVFVISTQVQSECEVVNKEKQQFNEQNWKMGEKNWSFSVVADKSSLLWSVIWAIFPFRVGTEIRFAEISFEPQCAGQAVLSHSTKLFHPTSIKAPSNPLDSLTHQANWGSSRPGLCFRTKPMKLLIYSCSEHAPTALGTVWSLFPREPPWCWAHPLLSWAAGGFWGLLGFFSSPLRIFLKTSIQNNLLHLIDIDFYLQICDSSQEQRRWSESAAGRRWQGEVNLLLFGMGLLQFRREWRCYTIVIPKMVLSLW